MRADEDVCVCVCVICVCVCALHCRFPTCPSRLSLYVDRDKDIDSINRVCFFQLMLTFAVRVSLCVAAAMLSTS
jgi:hypothetical protein